MPSHQRRGATPSFIEETQEAPLSVWQPPSPLLVPLVFMTLLAPTILSLLLSSKEQLVQCGNDGADARQCPVRMLKWRS